MPLQKKAVASKGCYCFDCFYVRPSDFLKVYLGQTAPIGCINHDRVVAFCSELRMRLDYYLLLGYGNFFVSHGYRTMVLPTASRLLYP